MTTREQVEERILRFLRDHGHRSFRVKEIAKKLDIRDNDAYPVFRSVLESLKIEGRVAQEKGGRIAHQRRDSHLEGILRVHRDGFGFVSVPGEEQDYFIRARSMQTAIDGDRVLISRAASKPGDRRRSGEIIAVLERTRKQAVGTLRKSGAFSIVIPDDQRLLHDIYVSTDESAAAADGAAEDAATNARDGDKVVVSIDSFEDRRGAIQGRILKVLGPSTDPAVQTLAVAMSVGVRSDFSDAVLNELSETARTDSKGELGRREDLRDKCTFTIDPVDAKDFDDALHVDLLPGGDYEIGVHIADVSHFVKEGSLIDKEAYERGTSVYLVDRVLPMLPDELSNDLCSLNPEVDRLAFSCIMRLSSDGIVRSHRICETVIHSKYRLTYEGAQEILDLADTSLPNAHPLAQTLAKANVLAKKLAADRRKEGAVGFNQVEIRVLLDDDGHPIRIVPRDRVDAHRLVEEFMLLANRTVARAMCEASDDPFISRIHDPPDREKIRQLAAYVRPFGYTLPHQDGQVRAKDLNDLLDSIKGKPEEPIIEMAALRSMSKARYGLETTGHYGLSVKYYTHFTSPIRRYPDLLVHRMIKRKTSGQRGPGAAALKTRCEHLTEREKIAVDAERASVRLKQVEYAGNHLGESFAGVTTGVSRFGVFVQITDLLVEGMVHVRDLDDDYYEYDERTYSLIGTRTKRTFRLGDSVRVIIASANTETREIDLLFDAPVRTDRKRSTKRSRRRPR